MNDKIKELENELNKTTNEKLRNVIKSKIDKLKQLTPYQKRMNIIKK